jgi:glycosyltransferase involved in cell wall biosynthesis
MEAARVHKLVDKIVVPSAASARVLKDQGFKSVKVIPHGISQHLLTFESDPAALNKLNLPLEAPVIFCPCRADEHKDLPVFIRGAGLLQSQLETPAAFLATSKPEDVNAQESPEVQELPLMAPLRGLTEGKDIFFTAPFRYGSALAAVYRRSSVVVVPSVHESFGQNVLDAFMFGKPVVARNSMALKEIVHHESNGLLFETARELAWQVRRLLHDPELVARIVETARQGLAQQYGVDRMARDYRSLYDEVLQRSIKVN